ncbi:MAG: glycosyltransferase [Vicinamibacteraceae bacterium]|nr:glycosyltransferase [Vicinamibacteraceae bacterium]
MTVLFVSRALPLPAWHGDRLILRHLAEGLRARGHRVVVAALATPDDDAGVLGASAALCDRLATVSERPRTPLDYLARWRTPCPERAEDCWQPAMWRLVSRLAGEEAPGVVHFIGGIQVCEYRRAAAARPVLITPYESHTLWLDRAVADARTRLERWRWQARRAAAAAFERRIFDGFARVVVLTEADRERLASLAPHLPLTVVPNGVTLPARIVPIASRREPLLVFVGNFAYGPNVLAARALVREVLPRVQARVPHARAALVGALPGPDVLSLRGPAVEVTGAVVDIAPWLERARAFVGPIARGAGMKNKVLEALAHGTPLAVTSQGCEGIGLVDGVHALLGEGPAALAEAAVRLLDDEGLASRLAQAGRALVESRFQWSGIVAAYERIYSEIGASA